MGRNGDPQHFKWRTLRLSKAFYVLIHIKMVQEGLTAADPIWERKV